MDFNSNRWNRISYGAWAPVYDWLGKAYNPARRRAVSVLDARPGEHVLIVGAGTGLDLDFLPSGIHLTAIDLTPAMLDRLRRRAERLGLEVDARVMDGHALEFPDSSFDAVVLHLIVAVIPDPGKCLVEASRVLRSGGRAVVMDKFIADDCDPPLPLRMIRPLSQFFGTDFSRKLGPAVSQAGLRVEHEEPLAFGGYLKVVVLRKN